MSQALADRLLARLAKGDVAEADESFRKSFPAAELPGTLSALQSRGYTVTREGGLYRLSGTRDLLLSERLEAVLRHRRFGTPRFTYGRLGSTNEVAARLASADAPEGTLVTAEEQTRGRGRQGKSWHSPAGAGIWMSLVLRPKFGADRAVSIPLLGALAIAEGIRAVSGTSPELKWPNDVYLGGLKLAGVLGESVVDGANVRFAVLGMGINVNLPASSLPPELQETAGSLAMITGKQWDRVDILAAILAGLEARYDAFAENGFDAIRMEFLQATRLVGRSVDVLFPHTTLSGTVLDLSPDGDLLLATEAGSSRVRVGEASLKLR